MSTRTQKTICPYDCPTSCGLLVETDGKNILRVKGDPDDPVTQGLICRKMQHYEKSIHSPDRIMTPLKRIGDKGEGRFEPVSWDEAVQTVVRHWRKALDTDGPDSILPFYYSGVMSLIHRHCGEALFNRMGACSLVKTLCSSGKGAGYASVMGSTGCLDPRETAKSDFFIIWGSNMKATRLHGMPLIAQARKRGKRVVLIEPYARAMAPYCDQVVPIIPGTDGALASAMMHVLLREGLADADFLRREAEGFDEFSTALSGCSPEWAEKITGVPAEIIVSLAEEYGAASAPAIILGSGNSRYGNGAMTVRLITILSAFTGAWARPGGGLCGCSLGGGPYVDKNRITRPDLRAGSPCKVNINRLSSALSPKNGEVPIRCLHVWACNPVGSVADQQGIIKGLENPELFTVVHERFMTDTARYADIILPATFSVEQSDCFSSYGYCSFGTGYRVVPPPGECKSNWDIFCMLADSMGYEDDHFKRTEDELLEELLAYPMSGLERMGEEKLDVLRTGGTVSAPFSDHTDWKTSTGKIRIVNTDLAEPVPKYTECHGGEYPLRLIAVPAVDTLNSIFLERGDLVDRRGPMTLGMNPDDASVRGISDGDLVRAFNDLGEVRFIALVTPFAAPGTVAAEGVFCMGDSPDGTLVNTLHHERLSDMGEATTLNDNTVDVSKV